MSEEKERQCCSAATAQPPASPVETTCPGGIDPGFEDCPKCGDSMEEDCAYDSSFAGVGRQVSCAIGGKPYAEQLPAGYQFRQRSGVGKWPQTSALWCDWCTIDRETYEKYRREPNKLVQVRPVYATQPPPAPVKTETRFHTDEDREYARGLLEDMDDEQSNPTDSRSNIAAQWFCKARVETARRVAKQHTQSSGNVEVPTDALINLVNYQEQCDEDGVMVKVSRQALTEVLVYVQLVRPESASREDVLEAQGTIEQLEKQLAFERKKSEPNFLHAGSPLWRIDLLCEQHELYTKDELVGLIQKVVQDDFCSRAQRIANDMG